MDELLTLSATALASRIRERSLSPVDAVGACIRRIEAVNPSLNAVVATRFAEARAEAIDAEAAVRKGGALGPLHGVPVTIKEFVAVRGMPHTAGIVARKGAVAASDATVVRRLRAAGAIVLGVTNAPEGGLWHETSNPIYGRTRNPHDLLRTAGGSSGGEGAILAAGGSPLGLGSDTGGSVRIPAGFCGICSHKPTGGRVPSTGHFPHAPRGADAPMQIGPMARHVEDLVLALAVIEGPDGIDAQCRPMAPSDPDAETLAGKTVIALPAPGVSRPTPAVAAAVHASTQALVERGARLAQWTGPDLSAAFELWAALLSESGEHYDEIVGAGLTRPDPLRQLGRWVFGRADHSGGVLALMLVEKVLQRLGGRVESQAREARALREAFDAALGPDTILVAPVYPRTAPRHRAIALRDPRDVGNTALFNVTESPVTVVRAGTCDKGLPIGVQLVGARGRDGLTLAAGRALQDVFGVTRPVEPRQGASAPFGIRLAS